MAKRLSVASEPLYTRFWNRLKRFPQTLHKGSHNPPATSGPAAAFLISGGIGAVTMMVVHHLSDTSKDRENVVRIIGSWIPGSVSLDPMWGFTNDRQKWTAFIQKCRGGSRIYKIRLSIFVQVQSRAILAAMPVKKLSCL